MNNKYDKCIRKWDDIFSKGKVNVKKSLIFILTLIVIDQVIKLLILNNCVNGDVVLIPKILFLRPVQNTNLSWIASMVGYKTPVSLMVVIQGLGLIIISVSYRYFSYLWIQGKRLLDKMLVFYISGLMCSFIDVVFWGGSLDFLRLFEWFTFDFKDMYINISIIFLLLYTGNFYVKSYFKMNKKERKQAGFWLWIKKGMPSLPIE